ncbi:hypothetical protein GCM10009647_090400 [Streptomyces sanglieri]
MGGRSSSAANDEAHSVLDNSCARQTARGLPLGSEPANQSAGIVPGACNTLSPVSARQVARRTWFPTVHLCEE